MRRLLRWLRDLFWTPAPWIPARVYDAGGTWGDAISVGERTGDGRYLRIHGWKERRPSVGDALRVNMESGRILRCRFATVYYERDPPDMFFATVEPIEYEIHPLRPGTPVPPADFDSEFARTVREVMKMERW